MRPIPNNILQPHVCCLIFKLKSGCWERRISYVDTSWIDWSGMFLYLSDDAKQQLTYFLSLSQAAWGGHTSKYLNSVCTEIWHLVRAHCHIKTAGSPNYSTLDFGYIFPVTHLCIFQCLSQKLARNSAMRIQQVLTRIFMLFAIYRESKRGFDRPSTNYLKIYWFLYYIL